MSFLNLDSSQLLILSLSFANEFWTYTEIIKSTPYSDGKAMNNHQSGINSFKLH